MSHSSNPEFHHCYDCGHKWRHGHHGGHNCKSNLLAQIKSLESIVDKSTLLLKQVNQESVDPANAHALGNELMMYQVKYKQEEQ